MPSALHARTTDPSADDVAAFADAFIARQLQQRHVPGAALIVVRDGRVILSRGYGHADLEQHRMVDPEQTIFPVGSLSKPVTALAVMQLWEQGDVELDRDILHYTPELTATHRANEPITLHQLLTHTAGFDPVMLAIGARSSDAVLPLGEYVRAQMPPRPLSPGRMINYANYDYGLAGYIVERVSGEPFANYMSRRILEPMEMRDSSFEPKIHEDDRFARGYDWSEGRFIPVRPMLLHNVPASGLCATPADMGRFIIAQLGGSLSGPCVVKPETLAVLQQKQFSHHPALPGWTYGLAERGNDNADTSERVLEHGGVWTGYTCKLLLIPERNVGLFVVYNRYESVLIDEFSKAFLREFYPHTGNAVASLPSAQPRTVAELSRYVGRYRGAGYAHSTFEKLRILWKPTTEIRLDSDDPTSLQLHSPRARPTRLMPTTDPLLFIRESNGQPVAFSADASGTFDLLFTGTNAYERCPWWEAPTLQITLFLGFTLLFAIASFVISARCAFAWLRKLRGRTRAERSNFGCRWIAVACAFANFGFLAALAAMLFLTDQREFLFGLPLSLQVLLRLPLIGGLLALLTVAIALTARSPQMTPWRRLRYATFAFIAAGFLPFLMYWNLVMVTI